MTNKEAREIINREIDKAIDDETYMTDEIYDALCVASKSIALQILKSEPQPCEDAISREDAIKQCGFGMTHLHIADCLRRLPSVTPSNDAIKEAYIKGYDYGVKDWFKSNAESCEDCISREQAVYVASGYCAPQNIADELRKLPSVTPQPKVGKWIKVTNGRGGHECDLCHEYAPSYQSGDEYLTKYCPNCGAKMEVEE